ncbi:hypothetical protein EDD18DRAFT_846425 [Armillaria luteobubalina]|uniref:Uncharacterized protein n=1 Tax=Armillaria luteobubalina TaxID=153913 RepID=A0AA39P9Q0_9AGAR|nr:hypothetical protein EDD18DRAFT_846425 [Armillaria luteobubalina]
MTKVSSPCGYIVAFHQRDTVKTISCSEYEIAMDVYNSISQQWAKIVLNTQNLEVLARYGETRWRKQCEEEAQRLTASYCAAPLQIAPYIVAFRQQDCVRMIGLKTSGSARALYDVISNDCAKLASDRGIFQVLASHGSDDCVKLCKDKILQLDAFNGNVPLQHASYVVAFHQIDHVRMIGFPKEAPARAVYNAISDGLAKMLMPMDRRRSQIYSLMVVLSISSNARKTSCNCLYWKGPFHCRPAGHTLLRFTKRTVLEWLTFPWKDLLEQSTTRSLCPGRRSSWIHDCLRY